MSETALNETDVIVDDSVDEPIEVDVDAADESNNAVGTVDVLDTIKALNNPDSAFYSSIKSDDFSARKAIAIAISGSKPIDENLGREINLINVIVLPVDLMDKRTGEISAAPRVILIDANGEAYHGTSVGLLTAVRNLFSALGEPYTWPEPLAIKVLQQRGNNGFRFFTISLVS